MLRLELNVLDHLIRNLTLKINFHSNSEYWTRIITIYPRNYWIKWRKHSAATAWKGKSLTKYMISKDKAWEISRGSPRLRKRKWNISILYLNSKFHQILLFPLEMLRLNSNRAPNKISHNQDLKSRIILKQRNNAMVLNTYIRIE